MTPDVHENRCQEIMKVSCPQGQVHLGVGLERVHRTRSRVRTNFVSKVGLKSAPISIQYLPAKTCKGASRPSSSASGSGGTEAGTWTKVTAVVGVRCVASRRFQYHMEPLASPCSRQYSSWGRCESTAQYAPARIELCWREITFSDQSGA